MTSRSRWPMVMLAACLMLSATGFLAAQDAPYTVVAVTPDGVVLKGPTGTQIYDVAPGTMFNADGKDTAVADLKPGMKVTGKTSGIASWHNTSVMVHQELDAKVMAVSGNSILIKGKNGTNKYTWEQASDFRIMNEGKPIDPATLKVGDRITGMIVSKAVAPKMAAPVDTSAADAAKKAAAEKAAADKAAAKAAADKAAADKAAAKAAAADKAAADKAAADAAAKPAASTKKKLPKTASEVPFVGLMGVLSLAAGLSLSAVRKSRSAK